MKKINFKASVLVLLLVLGLTSCKNENHKSVENVVEAFYQNSTGKVFEEISTESFSKDLISHVVAAKNITKNDIERIKNSDSPTDKPLMIEGPVFTGGAEGHRTFKIIQIDIKNNTASVQVEFSNEAYKIVWKDTVLLVKESGWKIDNVIFGDNNSANKDAKGLLSGFVEFAENY
jgi:predicted lipoprotein